MFPGLLLGLVACAPPTVPEAMPTKPDAHKDALARYGAAVWNLRRDRLLTAARQLEEAAKKDPEASVPLRELIQLYCTLGREPDAIRLARRVLEKDPHDFDVAHTLTRLLFDAGDLKGAVAAAKLAAESPIPIGRAEKAVGVYRDLATVCEKANDLDTAEKAIRKAIALLIDERAGAIGSGAFTPHEADSAAAECLEKLGKISTKSQKYDGAVAAFESAAEIYRDKAHLNDSISAARLDWNLSGLFLVKGEPSKALVHLNRILAARPVNPEPYLRLGQLLRSLDRESEVIPQLRILESKDTKNLALKTVLAVEIARTRTAEQRARELFAEVMAETNDPKLMALAIASHLEINRAREIVDDLDRAFVKLKDRSKDEKADTPQAAAAKTFAAEKARAIAEVLRDDSKATVAVLQAVAADLQAGFKRNDRTYYFLGQLAARHRELSLAAHLYRDAIRGESKETTGDAYVALIELYRLAGKPADVADICRDGLRNADTVAPFYFNFYLSEALAELGEESAAIAAADKAIEETGHNNRLLVRLHKVRVLTMLNRFEAALQAANKLYEEFPAPADRLETRLQMASVYSWSGKRAEAEAALRMVLEADPDNAQACNELGFILAESSRELDEAESLIRNAIELDKFERKKTGAAEAENAAYIDSLGWVYFRKGKFAEARLELEKATTLYAGATDPIVWDHLGDVLFKLGEKSRAKAAWEKAEELLSRSPPNSTHRRDNRFDEVKRKLKLIP